MITHIITNKYVGINQNGTWMVEDVEDLHGLQMTNLKSLD